MIQVIERTYFYHARIHFSNDCEKFRSGVISVRSWLRPSFEVFEVVGNDIATSFGVTLDKIEIITLTRLK